MSQTKPIVAAPPKPSGARNVLNFVRGGMAGMFATCCIQPIDIVKVRIQLRSEAGGMSLSPFKVAKDIFIEGGMRRFYIGLDSALVRQATYTTTRFGIYFNLFDYFSTKRKGQGPLPFWIKASISLTAGALAAIVGNPFDLILIRMQADGMLPPEQRRNYGNVLKATYRVPKEEGILNLWKGSLPTVVRAMAINFGMLGPYDECKERLSKYFGMTMTNYLISCSLAGFLAAFFALPFDNLKTKLQKMKVQPDGKYPYSGMFDCMVKSIRREGFTRLWAGFPTFYVRIAPHAMICLLVTDFLRKVFHM